MAHCVLLSCLSRHLADGNAELVVSWYVAEASRFVEFMWQSSHMSVVALSHLWKNINILRSALRSDGQCFLGGVTLLGASA